MSFTLDHLQSLLKQQEKHKQVQRQKEDEYIQLRKPLQAAIQNVWQQHGVLSPIKGTWQRPVPCDLYKCPLSVPYTALVPWNSLPRAIQDKIPQPNNNDETAAVEIPRSLLVAKGEEEEDKDQSNNTNAGSTTTLNRRPLGGNLTNKLTEYTRGVSGQCRPFRAGGLDRDEIMVSEKQIEEFRSPEEIAQAQEVLKKGAIASWKDGTILTAPPGVDFDVGLSWKDVYGEEEDVEEERIDKEENTPKELENVNSNFASFQVSTSQELRTATTVTWDHGYFDDDSLFGSSSDDSNSDDSDEGGDEDDDDKENEEKETKKVYQEEKIEMGEDDYIYENRSQNTSNIISPELSSNEEDVDALLAELSSIQDVSLKPKKSGMNTDNPLELAERQAKLQNDATRKSWANTTLLPIDDFNTLIPNPALTYPFTLDDFQQQAVARLERSESVFVAAHTSAGKTVVAEYACALAKQRGTRCVYTSPIKALSNQKFRDFCIKFGSENVGLITGDMQLNADDSTCLIMTTEILRSMLYRGADLIRDIEFVIFDEVHYVNDTERGVVWEEVIIMLPAYVNMVFLSATTPNTIEFSDWIGRTKRRPVNVIKTDYRPVPLSHFLWAGLKLHKVMEGKSGFLEKGYREASISLQPKEKPQTGSKGKSAPASSSGRGGPKHLAWQAQGSKQNWMSLIRFLDREDLTPTVVFSFSKKKCEEIADMLRSLDLNTAAERSAVQGFTLQTRARLSPSDAGLPQVITVCEMVQRGIGVHHGGLLPILKEMVEILFSKNLIKVLFATETFAMGVNMPARAVVFNSIRKHDGIQFRVLEPGEYTQMAGRAGRRGLDTVGTVIMCCFGDSPPPMPILRNMLTGSSTLLRSQFRLTYNMILNLLRVEEMSVEGMIKRSFSEFATQRALTANEYPKLLARGEKTLAKLEEQFELGGNQRIGVDDLEPYFETCSELILTSKELLSYVIETAGAGDMALQPGRVILLSAARKYGIVRAPALVLKTPSLGGVSMDRGGTKKDQNMICIVLLPESYVQSSSADGNDKDSPKVGTVGYIGESNHRHYAIYDITLDQILVVTSIKKKIDPLLLFKEEQSTGFGGTLGSREHSAAAFFGSHQSSSSSFDNPFAGMKVRGKKSKNDEDDAVDKKSKTSKESQAIDNAMSHLLDAEKNEIDEGLPILNLKEIVKRGSDVVEFQQQCGVLEDLIFQMRSFASHKHPSIEKFYTVLERKMALHQRVEALRHLLSNESLRLFPDFLQRKAVLRTLGYLDSNETVCVKGRVACEVNTCDELIVTEMVFEGLLNDLDPTEIVAALSSLVYQAKSGDDEFDMEIPETLLTCCKGMKTIATNLGQLQKEHGLDVDPIDYCDGALKFGLVHVVYEWALGVPFSNICTLTTAQEGSIVRCITRLDELCREVRNCARVVGNPTLYRKMEAASVAIKRDIVFAPSLYVS